MTVKHHVEWCDGCGTPIDMSAGDELVNGIVDNATYALFLPGISLGGWFS